MSPYQVLRASTVAMLGTASVLHFASQNQTSAGELNKISRMPLDEMPNLVRLPVGVSDLRSAAPPTFDPSQVNPLNIEDEYAPRSNKLLIKLKEGIDIHDALPLLSKELGQELTFSRQLLPRLFEIESDQESSSHELQLHQADLEDLHLVEFCNVEIGSNRLKPTDDEEPIKTNDEKTRQQLRDSGYDDQFIERQWSLVEPTAKREEMEAFGANVLKAHQITKGAGAVGSVIDAGSGSEPHEDMRDRFLKPMFGDHVDYCDKESGGGHGMFVSGQIAANENNGVGISGVAPESKLTLLKGLSACDDRDEHPCAALHILMLHAGGFDVDGLPKNENPATVINLSLGAQAQCPPYMQEVIDALDAKGVSVVVAAGNERMDAQFLMPANCDKVITVGASDYLGQMTSYSNFGRRVDLMAPGGDRGHPIISLSNMSPNAYSLAVGTSMATPIVAGAALLMQSLDPTLLPQEVRDILKKTAREFPHGCFRGDENCGSGGLDTYAAVITVLKGLSDQGRLIGAGVLDQTCPVTAPLAQLA